MCVYVCMRECVHNTMSMCTCAYADISVMCVCVLGAVSPVGLSGYGLAAGEVAEQTQRGLSCSLTWPLRGFLALLPTALQWQMDPLGMLQTRSIETCK